MTRPRYCPWVTRPTHDKNSRIQVDKWTPVVFGYCPQEMECASCAGTGYKPNILLHVGRPTDTVACPFCDPEKYRREVQKLGKWQPPAPAAKAAPGKSVDEKLADLMKKKPGGH